MILHPVPPKVAVAATVKDDPERTFEQLSHAALLVVRVSWSNGWLPVGFRLARRGIKHLSFFLRLYRVRYINTRPRHSGRLRSHCDPQAGLMHERNDSLTEKLQIRYEVKEVDLNAVAACPLKADEPIDDLFGGSN